jgi:NAD(P)-dependent dehydrogenase (short-subunit alcohol dehydrogenase family)
LLPPADPPRRRRSTLLDSQLNQRHTQKLRTRDPDRVERDVDAARLVDHGLEMLVHGLLVETAHSTAKAALDGLLASLKWEAGAAGVLVNIVSPGFTVTENNLANFSDDVRESVGGAHRPVDCQFRTTWPRRSSCSDPRRTATSPAHTSRSPAGID